MIEPKVTVYGAYWCPDCRRSEKFLGEQSPFFKEFIGCTNREIASGWVSIRTRKTLVLLNHQPSQ